MLNDAKNGQIRKPWSTNRSLGSRHFPLFVWRSVWL